MVAHRERHAGRTRRARDVPTTAPPVFLEHLSQYYFFFSSATERIGVPSARVSGKVTECEYHPGIEAE